MIQNYLIAALISALLSFGGAWKIQSWRYDAKEKVRVEQILVDVRSAAATAIRRGDNVIVAENKAAARMVGLRADADHARSALVGLSDGSAEALRAAGASKDAAVDAAATALHLLGVCGKEYQDLGEQADRHISDIQTLTDSWPK